MHPTRDTQDVIFSKGLGGRVMPGVRLLSCSLSDTQERKQTDLLTRQYVFPNISTNKRGV
jgi:hypothetical protein